MSTIDQTAQEVAEQITGFEEIALTKAFGPVEDLAGSMEARALIFLHFKRSGQNDAEAKNGAMSLTAKEMGDFFAEDDEFMPDEPVTESGKDDSLPE